MGEEVEEVAVRYFLRFGIERNQAGNVMGWDGTLPNDRWDSDNIRIGIAVTKWHSHMTPHFTTTSFSNENSSCSSLLLLEAYLYLQNLFFTY